MKMAEKNYLDKNGRKKNYLDQSDILGQTSGTKMTIYSICKDDLLDQHKIADSFPDSELVDIGRPLKSLVVVVSWACLLVLGIFKFLQWSNLLSSWKGLTFTATGLGIITFLMQILIQFSQAERSSPAKVAPARSSNGNGSVQETLH
ncbi:putative 1-acylglycerol-3-phosphate O-acyltransferase [Helianthus annuus]|uniref:1-acylglycerol-3-phosphate O-acyltransferase n=1 Tax=Helianthus annuus TaxID=4232 RepID=A0A251SNI5_HELAN|nr:putative 1-acylglycerol-3-phosphate O-acyltransferase [Helianthus annuus]KAJ0847879.1 putative 1-acylglycerol-3-phosphate O-acyltransferase [Helianthus annuus]